MPGLYHEGEYDLAGFIVGAVEKKERLTGKNIRAGDALLGLPSNGLHTNGYSLARKLLFEIAGEELTEELAAELLKVHRSYLKPIRALIDAGVLKAAAHITGGGITDNLPRVLPAGLGAEVQTSSWQVPEFFERLRAIGNIPESDWRRTFNLGIGMILVVGTQKRSKAEKILNKIGERFQTIGSIVKLPQRRVIYT
jgi:phosphoribosylformylglycinamidine cyclo-ligase